MRKENFGYKLSGIISLNHSIFHMDKTKLAVNVFDSCAQQYQDQFMNIDQYHSGLEAFCAFIEGEKPKILDVACGPGNITLYLAQQIPQANVLATDLAPNMLELAKKNVPDASFKLLDAKNISSLNQRFDGIVLGFVLPYLDKEESLRLIADAYSMLNDGGALYLSTMEDDYSKSNLQSSVTKDGVERTLFMHFHEEEYLADQMKALGFKEIHSEKVVSKDKHGEQVVDMILIGKK